jgi:hypothetical protein
MCQGFGTKLAPRKTASRRLSLGARSKERKTNMRQQYSLPVRIFRYLGKVQFTMVLLIAGGLVMALGTVIESRLGAEVAQSQVYHTFFFDLYLFLIGVNLIVAVLNRIPIQRRQWAFVLTHSSIVLLLFGAWISRTYGVEGQLSLVEGSNCDEFSLLSDVLSVKNPKGEERIFPLGKNPKPGLLSVENDGLPSLRILDYQKNAEYRVKLVNGTPENGPGVEVHLKGRGNHAHEWLIRDHPYFRRKDLAPFEIGVFVARSEETLEEWLPKLDAPEVILRLRLSKKGPLYRFRIPEDLGKEKDLQDGVRIELRSFLKRARVVGKKVKEDPSAPINPALVFAVQKGDHIETYTVFSQFPEFNVVQGKQGEALLSEVRLSSPDSGEKPLVRILIHPKTGRLWVQLSARVGRGEAHSLRLNKAVVLGSFGYEIKLLTYFPHAKPEVKLAKAKKKGAGEKWLQAQLSAGKGSTKVWIRHGSSQPLMSNGSKWVFSFVPAVQKLPFSVHLEKVKAEYYPGTKRPRQYWSRVRFEGEGVSGVPETISMNKPLDREGYRFFQSGYLEGKGGRPSVTYLSVSYDPGVPLVYFSFFALIFGVAWYVKNNPVRRGPTEFISSQESVSSH